MNFQLDTSGSVGIVTDAPQGGSYCQTVWWRTLSPFTQGYIEALFATSYDVLPGFLATADQPREGYTKTAPVGFSDLAPETLARIIADCESAAFFSQTEEGGRFFWAQRQAGGRHWSSDFPPLTVQLGDDGKVRFA